VRRCRDALLGGEGEVERSVPEAWAVRLTPVIYILVGVVEMEIFLIAIIWGERGVHWWKH
jgi:hypothetical protein